MLTQERLKELLHYDPETGVFTRRITTSHNAKAGAVAGSLHIQGYIEISVDGKPYLAHRLAWLYVTGARPVNHIDHRDLDKTSNRFANLREATNGQNVANRRVRKDSRLGLKGVRLHVSGKYSAQININGKSVGLGTFPTPEEAHAAYAKAANDNFGEFARTA